jgi:hypothetical protein
MKEKPKVTHINARAETVRSFLEVLVGSQKNYQIRFFGFVG